jgi:hypothetical protein
VPTVVAGDINLDPYRTTDVSTELWSRFVSADGPTPYRYRSGIAEADPPPFTSNICGLSQEDPTGLLLDVVQPPAGPCASTLDHVAATPDVTGTCDTLGEAPGDSRRLDGGGGTDHRGIACELVIGAAAARPAAPAPSPRQRRRPSRHRRPGHGRDLGRRVTAGHRPGSGPGGGRCRSSARGRAAAAPPPGLREPGRGRAALPLRGPSGGGCGRRGRRAGRRRGGAGALDGDPAPGPRLHAERGRAGHGPDARRGPRAGGGGTDPALGTPGALTCRASRPEQVDEPEGPGGLTPRAERLRGELEATFGPQSLGGFAPGGVRSGHIEGSAHYEGRAVDVFFRPVTPEGTAQGWRVAHWLVAHAEELGVATVIFDRQVWTARRSGDGWRDYRHPSGDTSNPILNHEDHVHVDVGP